MNISQTYYTSSLVGIRGGQGFQINAATPGLAADILNSVERLGGYAPPPSAPSQPTPEEIENFPVSLVFSRLSNGDAAIGQSKYLGKDSTGRYGNFFAHFVIIRHDEMQEAHFVPVQLWQSGIWTTTESLTTELPLLRDLEPGTAMDVGKIAPLLKSREDLRVFGHILTAVERALGGGLRMIIANSDREVVRWIALATQVLPLHLAWQVSFTTYSKSPAYANVMITGTTQDSDFGFSDFEINHQYAVFDFYGNRFSPIQNSAFADLVCDLFNEPEMDIFSFPDFIKRKAPDLSLDELAVAFGCFARIKGIPCDVSVTQLCDWCTCHVKTLEPAEIHAIVEGVADEASRSIEGLRAIQALVHACVKDEMVEDVAQVFVSMVLRALPSADIGWLSTMPDTFHTLNARTIRPRESVLLSAFNEPDRLCAAVSILDEAGMLQGTDEDLRDAGRRVIGAHLLEPATRKALLDFPRAAANDSLMQGVVSAIEKRASDTAFLSQLKDLLLNETILARFENIAERTRSAELSTQILAVRLRGDRQSAESIFLQLIAHLKEFRRRLKAADFDLAYEIVWGEGGFDEAECSVLLRSFTSGDEETAFGDSNVPARMAESILARYGSLTPGDLECAQQLVKEFSPSVKEAGDQLSAVLLINTMRHGPMPGAAKSKPPDPVKRSWELIPNLEGEMRDRLVVAATRHLFDMPDEKKHWERLADGLEKFPGEVARAYAAALRDIVKQDNDPEIFIRLAETWLIFEYRFDPKDCESIVDAVGELYRGFDRRTRAEINARFERNPKLGPYWKDIIQRGTFLGIPRKWIGGSR